MPTPSLRGLQAFEAIGRCGSVSAAAKDLGVSPGAISQLVRNLEQCLGLTLLERRGRRVELSSWGQLYYRELAKGFQQLSHAANVLTRARNETGIVLSALTSVASRWVSRKIFDWQSLCPESNVRIVGQEEEPRIGIEQVDFRITYGRRSYAHEHVANLFTDWIVPVCSPALIANRVLDCPQDILKFPLLNVEWEADYKASPQWKDWASLVNADGRQTFSGLSFTLSSSAIDAAANGRGFVLAQVSMVQDEVAAGSLVVPFDIRMKLPESYYLAWDRTALEKPFGQRFHKWLVGVAKQQDLISAPSSGPVKLT
ncbi:LysR family transcriptional regulator [Pararhizobium sp. YC-54]|uniref:LysR family transcriptional regulator n=1 Tax=Pararhizobium sp. YC-54 TaxID=2986920 RepID=UPI0021F7A60E|nr:LysR family transcriptional regulator [Pararhizobium sp. YC-54]MCW0001151.1 LysR family transcriptional regulator [Pararhizobium sp. YC-54]